MSRTATLTLDFANSALPKQLPAEAGKTNGRFRKMRKCNAVASSGGSPTAANTTASSKSTAHSYRLTSWAEFAEAVM